MSLLVGLDSSKAIIFYNSRFKGITRALLLIHAFLKSIHYPLTNKAKICRYFESSGKKKGPNMLLFYISKTFIRYNFCDQIDNRIPKHDLPLYVSQI